MSECSKQGGRPRAPVMVTGSRRNTASMRHSIESDPIDDHIIKGNYLCVCEGITLTQGDFVLTGFLRSINHLD